MTKQNEQSKNELFSSDLNPSEEFFRTLEYYYAEISDFIGLEDPEQIPKPGRRYTVPKSDLVRVNWDQFKRIVPETISGPYPRDTAIEELLVLNRASSLEGQSLVWRGDWFSRLYTLGFEFNEGGTLLKPIMCVNPPSTGQQLLTIQFHDADPLEIPMKPSGICAHQSCPLIGPSMVIDRERMEIHIDNMTAVPIVRR